MRPSVKCSKRRGTYPLGVHPVHAVSNHLDSTKRGRRRGSAEGETSRVGRRRAAPFFTAHANNTNNGSGRTPVAASAKTKPTNGTETQVEARATSMQTRTHGGYRRLKTKTGRSNAQNVHGWLGCFLFFLRWRYRVDAPVGYAENPYTTRRTLTLAGPAFVGSYITASELRHADAEKLPRSGEYRRW